MPYLDTSLFTVLNCHGYFLPSKALSNIQVNLQEGL